MPEAEQIETLRLTAEGLEMPDELVGFTGNLVVEWPSEKLQTQTMTIQEPGVSEVWNGICRGVMPSETVANGVPGGHLRIDGTLYEIEDARTEVDADV